MCSKFHILIVVVLLGGDFKKLSTNALESPRAVPKITSIPSQVSGIGEAPYFHEQEQALYYVDIPAGDVIRFDAITGIETKIHIEGNRRASAVIPYFEQNGQFIVANENLLLKLDWTTGNTEVVAEVTSDLGYERFNDAKCDPMGRLFIGSILNEANGTAVIPNGGSLYRLDGNNLIKLGTGYTISNGMSWSNDPGHEDFYFNDSGGRKMYHFKYNITDGSLSNERLLIDVETHPDFVELETPDGQAMDPFGFIWAAMWDGGRIVKINPATAGVVDEVRLPRVKVPTSLAFGTYKGEWGMYVTTAGLDGADLLDDGKIQHISFQGADIHKFNPNA